MQYPEPLTEGVNYLLTNSVVKVKSPKGPEYIVADCAEIWPVDADAEHRVFLCTKCGKFTGDTPATVVGHSKAHAAEEKRRELIFEAWELLPKEIRATLLRRAEVARYGKP